MRVQRSAGPGQGQRRKGQIGSIFPTTALLCLLLAAGCREESEVGTAEPNPAVAVQVVAVRRGDLDDVLTAVGETEARVVLRLASPVAGRITYLPFQAGDRIARGTTAARVIPLESEAALHGFALLDRSGILPGAEQDRARQLVRRLASQEVALSAPFASVVAARLHNPGEQVAANDALIEMFDPTSLYVVAQVPVAEVERLRSGSKVIVTLGQSTTTGTIAAIGSTVTPQSLTVPLRVEFDPALDPPLLHAAVRCRILVAHHAGTLLIPRSALLSSITSTHADVLVAVDGLARRRSVELGLRNDDSVEITEGLQEGEQVLSSGQYGLPDGTPIKIAAAAESNP